MPVRLIQQAFAGGELAPSLYARSDIDKYPQGVKVSRNGYPNSHGAWKNRAGFQFIGPVYDERKASRLIPFSFSDEQTYTLEISDRFTRVLRDEGFVMKANLTVTTTTAGTPVRVRTSTAHGLVRGDMVRMLATGDPLLDGFEFYVDWILEAVSGAPFVAITKLAAHTVNIETTTGHGYGTGDRVYLSGLDANNRWLDDRVYTITVIDTTNFTLDDVSIEEALKYVEVDTSSPGGKQERIDPDDFDLLTQINADVDLTSAASTATGTVEVFTGFRTPWLEDELRTLDFVQSADTITFSHKLHPPTQIQRGASHTDWVVSLHETTPSSITEPLAVMEVTAGDGGIRLYKVTAVDKETGIESPAGLGVVSQTFGGKISWTKPAFGTVEKYWVYAAEVDFLDPGGTPTASQYGLIGSASADEPSFNYGIAPGITPDYTISLPVPEDPFDEAGDFPRSLTYYQNRMLFAGTLNQPQFIWASSTGAYRTFSRSVPITADDAILAGIVGREVNPLLHLIGIGELFALTNSGVWLISGDASGVLTPLGGFVAKLQTNYGCSDVRPLQIGDVIIYVQSDGRSVRDLAFVFETDRHVAADLSILSKHLFRANPIVEWDFARSPDSLVWCVREDGTMIAMTYVREHKIFAWSRHDTDGDIETVSSVLEGSEDAVYLGVKRTINGSTRRFIEKIHTRRIDDVRDAFFVDAGLKYGYNEDATDANQDRFPLIVFKEDPVRFEFVANHGHIVDDFVDIEYLIRGDDPFARNGEPLLHNLRFKVSTVPASDEITLKDAETGVDIDGTGIADALGTVYARWPVATFSGLKHLEAKTVSILADGNVYPQQVVPSSGSLTLPGGDIASRVHIGIPYLSELETLAPSINSRQGSLQGVPALIGEITLIVDRTRGGFLGSDRDSLNEIKQRQGEFYGAPIELLSGELKHNLQGGWKRGSLVYQQSDPLPSEILAIVYKVEFGR